MDDSIECSDMNFNIYEATIVSFIFTDTTILLGAMKTLACKKDKHNLMAFETKIKLDKKNKDSKFKNIVTFYLDTIGTTKDLNNFLRYRKLCTDTSNIIKILVKCGKEIKTNGTFNKFVSIVNNEKRIQNDENCIILTAANKHLNEKKCFEELRETLKNRHFNSNDIFIDISSIDNVYYDNALDIERKNRLLIKWEKTRIGLQKKFCNLEYSKYKNDLYYLINLAKRENFVSTDMFDIINMQIQSYTVSCVYWMEKYELENESIDIDIQIEKENIEQKRDFFDKFFIEFNKKKNFIEKYIESKMCLKELQVCTIRIQAWWRGLMVRKKFGSFKPRIKDKPKKGKKNKNKK